MLTVMLCGANDTHEIAESFKEIVEQFGADPWYYQDGRIAYWNSNHSSWAANSQASVQQADLCVFVLVNKVGEITWNVELQTALAEGKPFLVLCRRETYRKYLMIHDSIEDFSTLKKDDQALLELFDDLESKRQLTAVPYEPECFGKELRRQMAGMFSNLLNLYGTWNRRNNVLFSIKPGAALSSIETRLLTEIVIDETEDKSLRKRAIFALRGTGLSMDHVKRLITSPEQGIQRLAFQKLGDLYIQRPFPKELLDFSVEIANETDDTGIARRLVQAVLDIDLKLGLEAMLSLDLTEIGSKRRLITALEEHENEIRALHVESIAIILTDRCLEKTTEKGWIVKGREFKSRLEENNP